MEEIDPYDAPELFRGSRGFSEKTNPEVLAFENSKCHFFRPLNDHSSGTRKDLELGIGAN